MIKSAIRSVGLDPESPTKVKTFSLGMKQRLAMAQALFEDPNILLLDEPTDALDKDGIDEVREILLREREKGKLIVIASHSKEDIAYLSDTVIHVSDGKSRACCKQPEKEKADANDGAITAFREGCHFPAPLLLHSG